MFIFFTFTITLFILIIVRLNLLESPSEDYVFKVSLNQINVDQRDKSNELMKEKILDEIINNIKNNEDQIYIYSETDYPFIILNDDIVNIFQKVLSSKEALIIGGIKKDNKKYYNSMYYITKNNFKSFDKKILVPFGEFFTI